MLMLSGPHLENHSPTAAFQVLSRGGSQLDVYSTLVSVSLSPWTSFFFLILPPHRLIFSPSPTLNAVIVISTSCLLFAPVKRPSFLFSFSSSFSHSLKLITNLDCSDQLQPSFFVSFLYLLVFVVCSNSHLFLD